jgi:hypothetical protein
MLIIMVNNARRQLRSALAQIPQGQGRYREK